MSGWIKLYRKITEWEWYTDSNIFRVFLHLLLNANHKPKRWRGIIIGRGQLITSRKLLSKQLKISEQSIRTSLIRLKSTNEIIIKTTNKFSLITICNYDSYQSFDFSINQQPTSQPLKINQQNPINQPTTNQQITDSHDSVSACNYNSYMTYQHKYEKQKNDNPSKFNQQNLKNQPAKPQKSTTNKNIKKKEKKKSSFFFIKTLFQKYTNIDDPHYSQILPVLKLFETIPEGLIKKDIEECILKSFQELPSGKGIKTEFLLNNIQRKIILKREEKVNAEKYLILAQAKKDRMLSKKIEFREKEKSTKAKIKQYKEFLNKNLNLFSTWEKNNIVKLLNQNKLAEAGRIIEPKIEKVI